MKNFECSKHTAHAANQHFLHSLFRIYLFVLFLVYLFFHHFSFYVFFSCAVADLSDFPFPSASACPSLVSSPVMARRDSILKHSGSVKNTERRVSIKQNQPIVVEYLSERRPSQSQQHLVSATLSGGGGTGGKSNARPASLIVTKGERPSFKLIRSPSIDQEQDEALVNALEAAANQAKLTSAQEASGPFLLDAVNSSATNKSLHSTKDDADDDDDESAPLVQIIDSTTITSSSNHL